MTTPVSLGWHFVLPLLARGLLPPGEAKTLAEAYDGNAAAPQFKAAVAAFQSKTGLVPDGDLGPKSWARFSAGVTVALLGQQQATALGVSLREAEAALPALQGRVKLLDNYVRIGGVPVPVPSGIRIRVDHRRPQLTARAGCVARNALVMHWGGLNAAGCYNVLKGRNLGTHLIAECEVGADGVLDVLQVCDLTDTAYHAGEMNRYAVGFDIARSPQVGHRAKYPGARIVKNPTPRGEREIIALPENYGPTIVPFIGWLADVFGLEYRYQGHQVIDPEPDGTVLHPERIRGVVGHHNVDRGKWDVAPWYEALWPSAAQAAHPVSRAIVVESQPVLQPEPEAPEQVPVSDAPEVEPDVHLDVQPEAEAPAAPAVESPVASVEPAPAKPPRKIPTPRKAPPRAPRPAGEVPVT